MHIAHGLLHGHVLQRTPKGATAIVTGTAEITGIVTATITANRTAVRGWSSKAVGKATKGSFTAKLAGIPTGGPYTVTLAVGSRQVVVQQVFVGDLWLMAGQSNMEGVGNIEDAPKPHPLVRNFAMDHRWELARDPLHHLPESPDSVHNNGTQEPLADREKSKRSRTKGTGVGVYFGKLMVERTGVPQGLIATAHGGTSMEQWDPTKQDLGGASLYGSMLSSLRDVAQPLAGVLWYQGCSETHSAAVAQYSARMQQLVAAVRRDLGQPKLPWITVQIGRVVGQMDGQREWNAIQELQRLLPKVIPHLDTVAAIDLELDDLIHVSGAAYATLGLRMALVADRLVLGQRAALPAIQPIAATPLPRHPYAPALEVRFANVVGGLHADGLPQGFSLVDHDQKPVELIYKTVLDGDRVILQLLHDDRQDVRVMYGNGKNPICNITDARGMAVPMFGPLTIQGRLPTSPWCVSWDVSAIQAGEAIAKLPRPQPKKSGPLTRMRFAGNFVDLHQQWAGNSGHVAFFSTIDLAEAMELELRTGYDGPFRLWVNASEVVTDLKGTNPAMVDVRRENLSLKSGRHTITVLMALNQGAAWGFFLRFVRRKVSLDQVAAGHVAVPLPLT